jgi:hypothetical protein
MRLIDRLAVSAAVSIAFTLASYAVHAGVLGTSLVPAVALAVLSYRRFAVAPRRYRLPLLVQALQYS